MKNSRTWHIRSNFTQLFVKTSSGSAPQAEQELKAKILPQLANNLTLGTLLIGQLRGYYKYRVSLFGAWYRIGYLVNHKLQELVIIAIGPRGGFYQRLKQRLG